MRGIARMFFRGRDQKTMEQAWNPTAAPGHDMVYGAIAVNMAHPDYARLLALYEQLRKEHDIYLDDNEADIVYEESDLASAEWLVVMDMESVSAVAGSIGDSMLLDIQCPSCQRSTLRQVKPLRIERLSKCKADVFHVDCADKDLSETRGIARLASARFRQLIESASITGVTFADVCDANGKVSTKYFQINVANRMAEVKSPTPQLGEACPACKSPRGVFTTEPPNPLDREFHYARNQLPAEAIALSAEMYGEVEAISDASRLLFIAQSLYQMMKKAKIKGIDFWPVRIDD